jgi:predicted secreted Zn-dependent protease
LVARRLPHRRRPDCDTSSPLNTTACDLQQGAQAHWSSTKTATSSSEREIRELFPDAEGEWLRKERQETLNCVACGFYADAVGARR